MIRPARRLLLLVACGALLPPAAAHAAVTATTITAPADGHAPVFDWLDGQGPHVVRITGTAVGTGADGADTVDVVCQRRGEPLVSAETQGSTVVAQDVPIAVAGGARTFSVAVDAALAPLRTPCRLRAIAANALSFDPAKFAAGPALFPSGLRDFRESALGNPNVGRLHDVDTSTVTPGRTSTAHLESFGGCGLWDARPLDPAVGPDVAALNVFDCAGYADDVADGTTPTRSELQVDGANAFTGAMAALGSGGLPAVDGRPPLTRTATRDPATGLLRLTESTDVVRCATTPAAYPFANAADCGTLVPTGLRMVRDATMSDDGRVTTMRDRWESADGAEHVLDLLFEIDFATPRYGIQLPWTAPDVSAYPGSASFPGPPSAPASIPVYSDRTVPGGDLARPTGAVSFATAPTSVEFISGLGDPSRFMELRYLRTIPAAAPLELVHTFSMAPTAAGSAQLAARAEDSYAGPAIAITAPAVGATSATADVLVTGTATDNRGVASLTVAGAPVAVGPDGGWSHPLRLVPGANAILARATDGAGNVSEASVSVLYTPAKARPCVVPKLKGLKSSGAAVRPLRTAGCRLGRSIAIYSRPKLVRKGRTVIRVVTKRFTILGTKQKRGRRLAPGAKVDLIVQGRRPRTLTPKQRAAARRQALLKRKAAEKARREAAAKPKPPVFTPDLPAR